MTRDTPLSIVYCLLYVVCFLLYSVLPTADVVVRSTLAAKCMGGGFNFNSKARCVTFVVLYPCLFRILLLLSIHLFLGFALALLSDIILLYAL